MKEINLEELKKIQLDILQYVHEFCVSHNIRYSLMYGTLLGAVRHKGFIPWDDDIDISMLREDYEKFAKLFNQNNSFYHFYDCRNDKEVNIPFGKVADTRTLIEEGCNSKDLGIAIDIFPYDDLYDTYEESLQYYKSFDFLKKLLILKVRKTSDVRSLWKKPLFLVAKVLFSWYSSHKVALDMTKKILEHSRPKSKYVGEIVMSETNEVLERDVFEEYQEMEFEDRKFMAVKEWHTCLTLEYGDYMKLPPENQRVPRHDFYKIYWL